MRRLTGAPRIDHGSPPAYGDEAPLSRPNIGFSTCEANILSLQTITTLQPDIHVDHEYYTSVPPPV
jgi:hypothetical protein